MPHWPSSSAPQARPNASAFSPPIPISLAQNVLDVPSTVDGEQLFARAPGRGRCEVVCFTSDHKKSFGELSVSRVRTVVDAADGNLAGTSPARKATVR